MRRALDGLLWVDHMKIVVVAPNARQPTWVDAACEEYRRRLSGFVECTLDVLALPKGRSSGAILQRRLEEHRRRGRCRMIAMDESGLLLTTAQWAQRLAQYRLDGDHLLFVLGDAEGLPMTIRREAQETWSLSPLTMAHGLARVVLLEQLYRAASLLAGHPYHRGNPGELPAIP
jgi:23S rRNA (pseudouridine1915-N3)-methyltransferase